MGNGESSENQLSQSWSKGFVAFPTPDSRLPVLRAAAYHAV
jgi:hypothetical protein